MSYLMCFISCSLGWVTGLIIMNEPVEQMVIGVLAMGAALFMHWALWSRK